MKQQLEELREETKRKEQRWTASAARLRDRVESLEKEKQELKVKVEELEKVNAAQKHVWKQIEANSKQTVSQVGLSVPLVISTADAFPSWPLTR